MNATGSGKFDTDLGGKIWHGLTGGITEKLEQQGWYQWPYWNYVIYGIVGLIVFMILFWFWNNFVR